MTSTLLVVEVTYTWWSYELTPVYAGCVDVYVCAFTETGRTGQSETPHDLQKINAYCVWHRSQTSASLTAFWNAPSVDLMFVEMQLRFIKEKGIAKEWKRKTNSVDVNKENTLKG